MLNFDVGCDLVSKKVFISYKYKDNDVQELQTTRIRPTWVCDYVENISDYVLYDHIYKGENQDEDLSGYSDEYIWKILKDKMFDSTVTIILISPNMREPRKYQRSQWIPWEISYSLRKIIRNDRTSQRNAIVAVVLPDKNGDYSYYYHLDLFPILEANIKNGYIYVADWDFFKSNPNCCISEAEKRRDLTKEYKIVVNL